MGVGHGALHDEELRQLNAITTRVLLEHDETVFIEDDTSTFLFNIASGAVRLSKGLPDGRRQITGFLFPGDFLGLSIANHYAYSAEVLGPTSLCRFNRKQLLPLLDRFPQLEHRLLDLASNELAQAQAHLMLLGRKTATERITSVLLALVDRNGKNQPEGVTIELPMTRYDLADFTGLSVETVSRTFSKFRKQGLFSMPTARSIIIHDIGQLEQFSGEYY